MRGTPAVEQPSLVVRRLVRVSTAAAFAAATLGSLLGGPLGRTAGGVALALVAGVPLVRLVLLGGAWYQRGDRRFAAVAFGVLVVVAAGGVAALVLQG